MTDLAISDVSILCDTKCPYRWKISGRPNFCGCHVFRSQLCCCNNFFCIGRDEEVTQILAPCSIVPYSLLPNSTIYCTTFKLILKEQVLMLIFSSKYTPNPDNSLAETLYVRLASGSSGLISASFGFMITECSNCAESMRRGMTLVITENEVYSGDSLSH